MLLLKWLVLLLCIFRCKARFPTPKKDINGRISRWERHSRSEYVVYDIPSTWPESVAMCSANNLRLAEPDNIIKTKTLARMLSDYRLGRKGVWIGAYRDLRPNVYRWVTSKNEIPSRRTPTDYPPWIRVNSPINRDCVYFDRDTFTWPRFIDGACFKNRPFICEKTAYMTSYLKELITGGGEEPPLVYTLKSKATTFYVYNGYYNWNEAILFCKEKGYRLAIIEDEETLKTMNEIVAITNIRENQAWIGGRKHHATKEWIWVNTLNPVKRSRLVVPGTNNTHFKVIVNEDCLLLSRETRSNAMIIPSRCHFKMPFICEKPQVELPQPQKAMCKNTSMVLYTAPRSWREAGDYCSSKGGKLIEMADPECIPTLIDLMAAAEQDVEHIWIGAHLSDKQLWTWQSDGTAVRVDEDLSCEKNMCDDFELGETGCLNLNRRKHVLVAVYGVACETRQPYVCQFRSNVAYANAIKAYPSPASVYNMYEEEERRIIEKARQSLTIGIKQGKGKPKKSADKHELHPNLRSKRTKTKQIIPHVKTTKRPRVSTTKKYTSTTKKHTPTTKKHTTTTKRSRVHKKTPKPPRTTKKFIDKPRMSNASVRKATTAKHWTKTTKKAANPFARRRKSTVTRPPTTLPVTKAPTRQFLTPTQKYHYPVYISSVITEYNRGYNANGVAPPVLTHSPLPHTSRTTPLLVRNTAVSLLHATTKTWDPNQNTKSITLNDSEITSTQNPLYLIADRIFHYSNTEREKIPLQFHDQFRDRNTSSTSQNDTYQNPTLLANVINSVSARNISSTKETVKTNSGSHASKKSIKETSESLDDENTIMMTTLQTAEMNYLYPDIMSDELSLYYPEDFEMTDILGKSGYELPTFSDSDMKFIPMQTDKSLAYITDNSKSYTPNNHLNIPNELSPTQMRNDPIPETRSTPRMYPNTNTVFIESNSSGSSGFRKAKDSTNSISVHDTTNSPNITSVTSMKDYKEMHHLVVPTQSDNVGYPSDSSRDQFRTIPTYSTLVTSEELISNITLRESLFEQHEKFGTERATTTVSNATYHPDIFQNVSYFISSPMSMLITSTKEEAKIYNADELKHKDITSRLPVISQKESEGISVSSKIHSNPNFFTDEITSDFDGFVKSVPATTVRETTTITGNFSGDYIFNQNEELFISNTTNLQTFPTEEPTRKVLGISLNFLHEIHIGDESMRTLSHILNNGSFSSKINESHAYEYNSDDFEIIKDRTKNLPAKSTPIPEDNIYISSGFLNTVPELTDVSTIHDYTVRPTTKNDVTISPYGPSLFSEKDGIIMPMTTSMPFPQTTDDLDMYHFGGYMLGDALGLPPKDSFRKFETTPKPETYLGTKAMSSDPSLYFEDSTTFSTRITAMPTKNDHDETPKVFEYDSNAIHTQNSIPTLTQGDGSHIYYSEAHKPNTNLRFLPKNSHNRVVVSTLLLVSEKKYTDSDIITEKVIFNYPEEIKTTQAETIHRNSSSQISLFLENVNDTAGIQYSEVFTSRTTPEKTQSDTHNTYVTENYLPMNLPSDVRTMSTLFEISGTAFLVNYTPSIFRRGHEIYSGLNSTSEEPKSNNSDGLLSVKHHTNSPDTTFNVSLPNNEESDSIHSQISKSVLIPKIIPETNNSKGPIWTGNLNTVPENLHNKLRDTFTSSGPLLAKLVSPEKNVPPTMLTSHSEEIMTSSDKTMSTETIYLHNNSPEKINKLSFEDSDLMSAELNNSGSSHSGRDNSSIYFFNHSQITSTSPLTETDSPEPSVTPTVLTNIYSEYIMQSSDTTIFTETTYLRGNFPANLNRTRFRKRNSDSSISGTDDPGNYLFNHSQTASISSLPKSESPELNINRTVLTSLSEEIMPSSDTTMSVETIYLHNSSPENLNKLSFEDSDLMSAELNNSGSSHSGRVDSGIYFVNQSQTTPTSSLTNAQSPEPSVAPTEFTSHSSEDIMQSNDKTISTETTYLQGNFPANIYKTHFKKRNSESSSSGRDDSGNYLFNHSHTASMSSLTETESPEPSVTPTVLTYLYSEDTMQSNDTSSSIEITYLQGNASENINNISLEMSDLMSAKLNNSGFSYSGMDDSGNSLFNHSHTASMSSLTETESPEPSVTPTVLTYLYSEDTMQSNDTSSSIEITYLQGNASENINNISLEMSDLMSSKLNNSGFSYSGMDDSGNSLFNHSQTESMPSLKETESPEININRTVLTSISEEIMQRSDTTTSMETVYLHNSSPEKVNKLIEDSDLMSAELNNPESSYSRRFGSPIYFLNQSQTTPTPSLTETESPQPSVTASLTKTESPEPSVTATELTYLYSEDIMQSSDTTSSNEITYLQGNSSVNISNFSLERSDLMSTKLNNSGFSYSDRDDSGNYIYNHSQTAAMSSLEETESPELNINQTVLTSLSERIMQSSDTTMSMGTAYLLNNSPEDLNKHTFEGSDLMSAELNKSGSSSQTAPTSSLKIIQSPEPSVTPTVSTYLYSEDTLQSSDTTKSNETTYLQINSSVNLNNLRFEESDLMSAQLNYSGSSSQTAPMSSLTKIQSPEPNVTPIASTYLYSEDTMESSDKTTSIETTYLQGNSTANLNNLSFEERALMSDKLNNSGFSYSGIDDTGNYIYNLSQTTSMSSLKITEFPKVNNKRTVSTSLSETIVQSADTTTSMETIYVHNNSPENLSKLSFEDSHLTSDELNNSESSYSGRADTDRHFLNHSQTASMSSLKETESPEININRTVLTSISEEIMQRSDTTMSMEAIYLRNSSPEKINKLIEDSDLMSAELNNSESHSRRVGSPIYFLNHSQITTASSLTKTESPQPSVTASLTKTESPEPSVSPTELSYLYSEDIMQSSDTTSSNEIAYLQGNSSANLNTLSFEESDLMSTKLNNSGFSYSGRDDSGNYIYNHSQTAAKSSLKKTESPELNINPTSLTSFSEGIMQSSDTTMSMGTTYLLNNSPADINKHTFEGSDLMSAKLNKSGSSFQTAPTSSLKIIQSPEPSVTPTVSTYLYSEDTLQSSDTTKSNETTYLQVNSSVNLNNLRFEESDLMSAQLNYSGSSSQTAPMSSLTKIQSPEPNVTPIASTYLYSEDPMQSSDTTTSNETINLQGNASVNLNNLRFEESDLMSAKLNNSEFSYSGGDDSGNYMYNHSQNASMPSLKKTESSELNINRTALTSISEEIMQSSDTTMSLETIYLHNKSPEDLNKVSFKGSDLMSTELNNSRSSYSGRVDSAIYFLNHSQTTPTSSLTNTQSPEPSVTPSVLNSHSSEDITRGSDTTISMETTYLRGHFPSILIKVRFVESNSESSYSGRADSGSYFRNHSQTTSIPPRANTTEGGKSTSALQSKFDNTDIFNTTSPGANSTQRKYGKVIFSTSNNNTKTLDHPSFYNGIDTFKSKSYTQNAKVSPEFQFSSDISTAYNRSFPVIKPPSAIPLTKSSQGTHNTRKDGELVSIGAKGHTKQVIYRQLSTPFSGIQRKAVKSKLPVTIGSAIPHNSRLSTKENGVLRHKGKVPGFENCTHEHPKSNAAMKNPLSYGNKFTVNPKPPCNLVTHVRHNMDGIDAIVFLIADSPYSSDRDFKEILYLVSKLVSVFPLSKKFTSTVVTMTPKPKVLIESATSSCWVRERITNMTVQRQRTIADYTSAIQWILTHFVKTKVNKAIFFFVTDIGHHGSPYQPLLRRLQKEGHILFAVSIGRRSAFSVLHKLVGVRNIVKANSFNELRNLNARIETFKSKDLVCLTKK